LILRTDGAALAGVFMRNEPPVMVISPRDFLMLSTAREMTLRLVQ